VIPLHAQLQIERIASVNFQVHDLAKARSFYTGILGLPEAFDLKDAHGDVSAAFFKINDDQYLEFSLASDGPDFLWVNAAFLTHDLNGLSRELQKLGLSPGRATVGADGNPRVQVKDPMGNTLEFVQYRKGSQQVAHRGSDSATVKLSNHLLHVGFAEDDEAAALAFYQDKLGFHEFLRGGPVVDHAYWLNMHMPVPSDDYIELMIHAADPASRRDHICFEVPDIHKAYDLLVSRGMAGNFKPFVAQNHRWIINLRDSYGVRVEIMGEVTADPLAHPAQSKPN
jgi:lactoylglutathione lyase